MKKTILASLLMVAATCGATEVYFSPKGGAAAALVREVDAAKTEVRVMTYVMTNTKIADALIAAKARGVDVAMVVDRSQHDAADLVAAKVAGKVPTVVDAKHPIQHNKVIIIDKSVVITGSFNFSAAAENSNAENMVVLRDPQLAQKYLANWEKHFAHSVIY